MLTAEIGTELLVLKLTCMPGIYGEADPDLEIRGVDRIDRNWTHSERSC